MVQLVSGPERCVFLEPQTRRCSVYPARPTQCRTFPFWRSSVVEGEWTDEVRALCEGIGRGPLHSIEEAERLMVQMENAEEE